MPNFVEVILLLSDINLVQHIRWRDRVAVKASASYSVDLGTIPKVESYQKTLEMVFTAFLLGAQHKKRIVWRTSRQACLLCPWARHLTGWLYLYVADRWPSRTSPDYNCKVGSTGAAGRILDSANPREIRT